VSSALRALPALVPALAAVHAGPALTARGPLLRVLPRLAGRGRPGGVALTFDDGPHPVGTPLVLAELDRLGWRATFFMLGAQARRHPEVARSVVLAGHEVAVHGGEHRNHLGRSWRWVEADLARACGDLRAITGVQPRWFRPPYGVLSAGSVRAARSLGLDPVLWTAWGKDWLAPIPGQVAAEVRRGLTDGCTVLLHDSDCTSREGSYRSTAAALPLLAAELRWRGLEVRALADHGVGRR
jgi:peptidoglycan-N-acetylglucosamine deacetylase